MDIPKFEPGQRVCTPKGVGFVSDNQLPLRPDQEREHIVVDFVGGSSYMFDVRRIWLVKD